MDGATLQTLVDNGNTPTVTVRVNEEYDREYTTGAVLARHDNSGKKGKVIGYSNSHGLCFAVSFTFFGGDKT